ncbi:integrase catalytic domain-containing protein [Trichonephila clavipes]|nr:integrase catalytic domain-containing protein [Trichonephila clavipes]
MKKAWDQELPQNIVNKFMKWFNEIQILKDVTVPRCMKIDIFTELHVFVDASKGSYAGCVFARSIVDSRVSVILVRAKSRVAPLKLLSIPRLELMACCVGARLVNSILKALNMPDLKVTLWSDSTTALWWIKEYGNWSVFVANRVKEIRQLTQIQSWKRFIARRGRPRIIYCDNGTNFRGAFNDLAKLDWHKISRETSTQKIVWKFIPPTAAWWGGWWERLVRIIKELLRRSLGKSILSYEELSTVICDCKSLINSRPLTYISENPQELTPFTPAMFLTLQLDSTDFSALLERLRKRTTLNFS